MHEHELCLDYAPVKHVYANHYECVSNFVTSLTIVWKSMPPTVASSDFCPSPVLFLETR